jgi:hypothetical protein
MNLLNPLENKFEKVLVTNSFYTIFETKASISFKEGDLFQFSFDEISNIRIVKKDNKILPLSFILVFISLTGLCLAFFHANSIFQPAYLLISFLCFILFFFVKKTTYELYIDQKKSVRHKFTVKKEMLDDVKFFVKTIRKIIRQKQKTHAEL